LPCSNFSARCRVAQGFNIALFMAAKQALAFTLASELITPDSAYCAGISYKERYACISHIAREPKPWTANNFGQIEWLPEASIDPAIATPLPKGARHITIGDIGTLDSWFGVSGRFPAMKVKTGEIEI
jgi:hypothetical protein